MISIISFMSPLLNFWLAEMRERSFLRGFFDRGRSNPGIRRARVLVRVVRSSRDSPRNRPAPESRSFLQGYSLVEIRRAPALAGCRNGSVGHVPPPSLSLSFNFSRFILHGGMELAMYSRSLQPSLRSFHYSPGRQLWASNGPRSKWNYRRRVDFFRRPFPSPFLRPAS